MSIRLACSTPLWEGLADGGYSAIWTLLKDIHVFCGDLAIGFNYFAFATLTYQPESGAQIPLKENAPSLHGIANEVSTEMVWVGWWLAVVVEGR